MKRLVIPALLSTLLLAASAQAHQIWLQQDGKSAHLYFGEYGENLREASPGLLDRFGQPSAVLLGSDGEQTLDLHKGQNAFQLSQKAGANQSIVAQDPHYPVFEHASTRTAWTPAARLITSDAQQAPRLTLDIVPTGKHGEFKLFYKNQPLPKSKVVLMTASGWSKDAYSDEQGLVKFDLPWQGTYLVEAHYSDKTAGERDGKPYDVASFATTLSLTQAKGLKALPAGPAKQPNK